MGPGEDADVGDGVAALVAAGVATGVPAVVAAGVRVGPAVIVGVSGSAVGVGVWVSGSAVGVGGRGSGDPPLSLAWLLGSDGLAVPAGEAGTGEGDTGLPTGEGKLDAAGVPEPVHFVREWRVIQGILLCRVEFCRLRRLNSQCKHACFNNINGKG